MLSVVLRDVTDIVFIGYLQEQRHQWRALYQFAERVTKDNHKQRARETNENTVHEKTKVLDLNGRYILLYLSSWLIGRLM